ncbi:MAG: hypothetical protein WCX74_02665 [Candidatus Paceibacterota bacterium]
MKRTYLSLINHFNCHCCNNRKGFIIPIIAFIVIAGAAITLINAKIGENIKQQKSNYPVIQKENAEAIQKGDVQKQVILKEESLSDNLKNEIIKQMEEKLGYKIADGEMIEINGSKLYSGSFIKAFSNEYLLVLDLAGSGAYSANFFGVFDSDNKLLAVDHIGGYTHSYAFNYLYPCNKEGKNLILIYTKGCSNGSPFCDVDLALKYFTKDGLVSFQNIFTGKNQEQVSIKGGKFSLYRYAESTNGSNVFSKLNLEEEDSLGKINSTEFWEYSKEADKFVLKEVTVFKENECIFKNN